MGQGSVHDLPWYCGLAAPTDLGDFRRLFAGLREREGADHVELDLPDDARARDVLAAMGLQPGQCIVALDREYAPADAPIRADHEVALIPPVSGGAGAVRLIEVTDAPLDLGAVAAAVRDPRAGAVVCFEGVTRDVEALDYEAYAEMAREKLEAIGEEEAARHGLCAVALVHRTGRVPLSEPSVIVAASARAPRRGVRGRTGADRPRQGRGADLEGRAHAEGAAPGRGRPARLRRVADLTLGEAARALGVSADTLRRWDRAGKLRTVRDARNRRLVPARRSSGSRRPPAAARDGHTRSSARNRFPGIVRSVEVDGVMALVEIEAGPFRSSPRSRATPSRSSGWRPA